MRMPFERLMEYAAALDPQDETSVGELARLVEEEPFRLMDACDAVRVMRGERTYLSPVDIRAVDDPVVRRAAEADRGGVASGSAAPDLFGHP
jgi:hypothetical protein